MDKKTKIEALVVGVILLLTLICYLRYEPITCPEMGVSCRYDRWTGNVEFTVWGDHWRPMRPVPKASPSPEALAAEGK